MTENQKKDYVVVGKIGTPFGVKGWIKILSYTDQIDQILDYDPWYLEDENGWRPIEVTGGQQHGKGLVVKFTGFDTPEQSRLLTGIKIGVQRDQLVSLKKDEFYQQDLEGLTVINQDGKVLGKVLYVMETGANDVLVIKNEKEHAIPYLKDVILSVDLEKREVHVNWELL